MQMLADRLELLQSMPLDVDGVEVALRVRGDRVDPAGLAGLLLLAHDARRRTPELKQLARRRELHEDLVARRNPRLAARVGVERGRRAARPELVLLRDPDAPRDKQVSPLGDELARWLEDLDPRVRAVGDVKQAFGIDADPVGNLELAGACPLFPPRLHELSGLVEVDRSEEHTSELQSHSFT